MRPAGIGCRLITFALVSFALISCSSTTNDQALSDPTFSGPWAAEFQQAYASTDNAVIKEILRDGLISDGELSEVKNRQISCLEDLGFTVDELETDGSSAIYPSDGREESMEEVVDRTNQAKSQCESETGWYIVSYLYTGTMKNPQNQDISSLMAECLVRVGLQPVGYTAEEYMSDLGAGVYVPYLEDQTTPEAKKFLACNDDPAHAQPVR